MARTGKKDVGHICGEVSSADDLRKINRIIRKEMEKVTTRAELTELKKRSDYLCTLTASPSWRTGRRVSRRGPRSDDGVAPQPLDVGRRVTGLAQDLVRVLAECRRRAVDAGAAVREPEARAHELHRAEA